MSYKLQKTEKELLSMQLSSGQTRKGPDFFANYLECNYNHKVACYFITHFYTIRLERQNKNHDYAFYWTKVHW